MSVLTVKQRNDLAEVKKIYEAAIDEHHKALKVLMGNLHEAKKINTPNQLEKFQRKIQKQNEGLSPNRIITV